MDRKAITNREKQRGRRWTRRAPRTWACWALVSAGLAICVTLLIGAMPQQVLAQVRFSSTKEAFTQGYSAYKARQYDIAVPALKFAADKDLMRAQFYLAKIYSDNSGGWTDHARAYRMLREIVAQHTNVDPKDYRIAPFVSQALTSIARYEREGIKALGLPPNTKRALAFFEHAASHFNDADAQFELAKHTLSGDGVEAQVPFALNWLAKLSKRGHAGAQAFLANLYWDGRYTVHDPVRALALITVAVENANDEDLFWIEDAHQNIFCEAGRDTRRSVHRVVGDWRHRFGRMQSASAGGQTEPPLGRGNQRTCANGDVVGDLEGLVRKQGAQSVSGDPLGNSEASVRMSRVKPDKSGKAALNGFALREAGATGPKDGVMATPTVETARTRSIPADNRSLNGFMLQGSSDFGFSAAPGRR